MRRAGIDRLTIMRISGHKTMSVFKRYNTMDENLRKAAAQLDTYVESCTDMGTNMDTKEPEAFINHS
jgi:hypothetical protein